MDKKEKASVKHQRNSQRRKNKIKTVAKKMIPTFLLALVITFLWLILLIFRFPFISLHDSNTDIGICTDYYYRDAALRNHLPDVYIQINGKNTYYISGASVSNKDGFSISDFKKAVQEGTTFVIHYSPYSIKNEAYRVAMIEDDSKKVFLSNWNVNGPTLLVWFMAWLLYIIFMGLFIWYKWNITYKKTKPGNI